MKTNDDYNEFEVRATTMLSLLKFNEIMKGVFIGVEMGANGATFMYLYYAIEYPLRNKTKLIAFLWLYILFVAFTKCVVHVMESQILH